MSALRDVKSEEPRASSRPRPWAWSINALADNSASAEEWADRLRVNLRRGGEDRRGRSSHVPNGDSASLPAPARENANLLAFSVAQSLALAAIGHLRTPKIVETKLVEATAFPEAMDLLNEFYEQVPCVCERQKAQKTIETIDYWHRWTLKRAQKDFRGTVIAWKAFFTWCRYYTGETGTNPPIAGWFPGVRNGILTFPRRQWKGAFSVLCTRGKGTPSPAKAEARILLLAQLSLSGRGLPVGDRVAQMESLQKHAEALHPPLLKANRMESLIKALVKWLYNGRRAMSVTHMTPSGSGSDRMPRSQGGRATDWWLLIHTWVNRPVVEVFPQLLTATWEDSLFDVWGQEIFNGEAMKEIRRNPQIEFWRVAYLHQVEEESLFGLATDLPWEVPGMRSTISSELLTAMLEGEATRQLRAEVVKPFIRGPTPLRSLWADNHSHLLSWKMPNIPARLEGIPEPGWKVRQITAGPTWFAILGFAVRRSMEDVVLRDPDVRAFHERGLPLYNALRRQGQFPSTEVAVNSDLTNATDNIGLGLAKSIWEGLLEATSPERGSFLWHSTALAAPTRRVFISGDPEAEAAYEEARRGRPHTSGVMMGDPCSFLVLTALNKACAHLATICEEQGLTPVSAIRRFMDGKLSFKVAKRPFLSIVGDDLLAFSSKRWAKLYEEVLIACRQKISVGKHTVSRNIAVLCEQVAYRPEKSMNWIFVDPVRPRLFTCYVKGGKRFADEDKPAPPWQGKGQELSRAIAYFPTAWRRVYAMLFYLGWSFLDDSVKEVFQPRHKLSPVQVPRALLGYGLPALALEGCDWEGTGKYVYPIRHLQLISTIDGLRGDEKRRIQEEFTRPQADETHFLETIPLDQYPSLLGLDTACIGANALDEEERKHVVYEEDTLAANYKELVEANLPPVPEYRAGARRRFTPKGFAALPPGAQDYVRECGWKPVGEVLTTLQRATVLIPVMGEAPPKTRKVRARGIREWERVYNRAHRNHPEVARAEIPKAAQEDHQKLDFRLIIREREFAAKQWVHLSHEALKAMHYEWVVRGNVRVPRRGWERIPLPSTSVPQEIAALSQGDLERFLQILKAGIG